MLVSPHPAWDVGTEDVLRHHPSHGKPCQPCAPGHNRACGLPPLPGAAGSIPPQRLGLQCLSRHQTPAARFHSTTLLCLRRCLWCLDSASSFCAAIPEPEPGPVGRGDTLCLRAPARRDLAYPWGWVTAGRQLAGGFAEGII